MKKFIKALGIIVVLPLSYLILTIILSYSYGLFLLLNTGTSQGLLSTSLDYVKQSISFNYSIFLLLSGIIISSILLLMRGNPLKECKFTKINFKNIVYISILSIFSSLFINTLTILLASLFPNYYEFQGLSQETITIPLFQVFIIILILPIFEEVFFRGVIFGYLRKNYKLITAIIIQALVFGCFHMSLVQGIYAVFLGILIALLYNYTNSLYISIIFHGLFNFIGIIVFPYIYTYFPRILYALMPLNIIIFAFISIIFFKSNKKLSYSDNK